MFPTMLGVVRWYNDKDNYGFLQAVDGSNEEFFTHAGALRFVGRVPPWGRRLMTGEYVEFTPGPDQGPNKRRQALGVSGVRGGRLLVEHGDVRFRSYTRVALDTDGGDTAGGDDGGGNAANGADGADGADDDGYGGGANGANGADGYGGGL